MPSHWGKITRVNLSTGKVEDLAADERIVRSLLGGVGIGSQLYLDRYDLAADPLGPENPLMFLVGPLNGTNLPGAGPKLAMMKRPVNVFAMGNPINPDHFAALVNFIKDSVSAGSDPPIGASAT